MENPVSKQFYEQWKIVTGWINGNLKQLSDEELLMELNPGKNHGIWLLGHLLESEDELSVFLGKEGFMYQQYERVFGQGCPLLKPDQYPEPAVLRQHWKDVTAKNQRVLATMTDAEWDEPHAYQASPPDLNDFFKTKGRCFMIWNLHQSYHNGQLAVLLSRVGKTNN